MTTKPLKQRIQLEGGGKIRAELERIGQTAAKALQELNGSQGKASSSAAGLSTQLDKVSASLDGVDTSGGKASVSIGGLVKTFTLLGASIAAAGAGLVALARGAADSITAAQQSASKAGLTVREFEKFGVVAEIAGTSASSVGTAFGNLTNIFAELERSSAKSINGWYRTVEGNLKKAENAAEAAELKVGGSFSKIIPGTQVRSSTLVTTENLTRLLDEQAAAAGGVREGATKAEEALARLGVALTKNGQPLKGEEIFIRVADALAKVGSTAQRVKIATEAGLLEFLPLLEQGGDNLRKTFAEIDKIKFGTELTANQRKTIGEFRLNLILFEATAKAGRDRLKVAFLEAFAGPVGEVIKFLNSNGGGINKALQGIIQSSGQLFQSLVDVFTGKVKLSNIVETAPFAAVQKVILTTVEIVKGFGASVRSVIDSVVKPAFQRLTRSAAEGGAGIKELISPGLFAGLSQIGLWAANIALVVGVLQKALFGSSSSALRFVKILGLLTFAIAGFLASAGVGTAQLEDVSTEFRILTDGLVESNKSLYSRMIPDAKSGGAKFTGTLATIRDAVVQTLSDLDATIKSFSGISISAILKNDGSAENLESLRQVREVFLSIRDAVSNAFTETVKFFSAGGNGTGSTLLKILDGIIAAFNYIAGTNFTRGGFVVVVLFTAWLGVLLPVLRALGAVSQILAGLVSIIFTVVPALARFGAVLLRIVGTGGRIALAFVAGGKAITTFSRVAAVALRGVLALITGLLGWPALLLAGAGLVYAYWDDIVKYAGQAWDAIKGFVSGLWDGFVKVAAEAWAGVKKAASETWDGIKTIATDTWAAISTTARDSWNGVKTIAQETWDGIAQIGRDSWAGIKTVATDVWTGLSDTASRFWAGTRTIGVEAWDAIKKAASTVSTVIARAFGLSESDEARVQKELVDPFKAAVEAVRQLMAVDLVQAVESGLSAVISALERMASAVETQVQRIESAVQRAKDAAASLPSGGGEGEPFASGGFVRGAGTGTSDSIPAWLSNGEFVIKAAAVRQYGVNFFRQLNGMQVAPRRLKMNAPAFAMGGLVDTASRSLGLSAPQLAPVSASLPGKSFDLVIGNERFESLYAPEQTASNLMRYAASAQTRSAGRKPGWVR